MRTAATPTERVSAAPYCAAVWAIVSATSPYLAAARPAPSPTSAGSRVRPDPEFAKKRAAAAAARSAPRARERATERVSAAPQPLCATTRRSRGDPIGRGRSPRQPEVHPRLQPDPEFAKCKKESATAVAAGHTVPVVMQKLHLSSCADFRDQLFHRRATGNRLRVPCFVGTISRRKIICSWSAGTST